MLHACVSMLRLRCSTWPRQNRLEIPAFLQAWPCHPSPEASRTCPPIACAHGSEDLRLTFNAGIAAPGSGQLGIHELFDGGVVDPDLYGSFSFTVETNAFGDPRVLGIQATGAILSHRTWYGIGNAAWPDAAPSDLQFTGPREGEALTAPGSGKFPALRLRRRGCSTPSTVRSARLSLFATAR